MEKIRGKYDNQIIIVILIVLAIALLVGGVKNSNNQSLIGGLEAQVEDQKEQMEQMLYALEQCKEMKKAHEVERGIFDDIINGRRSVDEGLIPTPELLSDKDRIRY